MMPVASFDFPSGDWGDMVTTLHFLCSSLGNPSTSSAITLVGWHCMINSLQGSLTVAYTDEYIKNSTQWLHFNGQTL